MPSFDIKLLNYSSILFRALILAKRIAYIFLLLLLVPAVYASIAKYTTAPKSKVEFVSFAPQETIRASSTKLEGMVDWKKGIFAFSIDIRSFIGFNSPLQREHFNENYMESHTYPNASFQGKIIEQVNIAEDKNIRVRAKGKLKIHGVEKEKIIYVHLKINDRAVTADAAFNVALDDYNIKIPRIVAEKLSPEIEVKVHTVLHEQ